MDKARKEEKGVSLYSQSLNLLETDPLEEIFALNMGEFLTEHLINPELADKISNSFYKSKSESLKEQLEELASIYSIDRTLALLGFEDDEEHVIYNSIAKTVKLMLGLQICNIYLCKKGENELKLKGSADEDFGGKIKDYVVDCWKKEDIIQVKDSTVQRLIFPMKNNFECIGAIEVTRDAKRPLEREFCELLEVTTGLFVTSLGIQKLIDEVKKVTGAKVVSTSELQNLRAQLTAIIGDLGDQQQSFVEILAIAVDVKKGKKKTRHSRNTAELSRKICEHLGLNEKTTDLIYYAGLLQNIGQITLDEELFNKKEKLTEDEWKQLQDSPNAGVSLLMNINFLSEVVPYINYQKERWDGKGTPEGLGGYSIPFGSRIIAVADAYCALTEDRAHRKALSSNEALDIIHYESGIKWDPTVVEALEAIKKD